jgi:hypothetical protein
MKFTKFFLCISLLFFVAVLVKANCPGGTHFEADGNISCGWYDIPNQNPDGSVGPATHPEFICNSSGECVSDCYPYECVLIKRPVKRFPQLTAEQLQSLHNEVKPEAYMIVPGNGNKATVYLMSKTTAQILVSLVDAKDYKLTQDGQTRPSAITTAFLVSGTNKYTMNSGVASRMASLGKPFGIKKMEGRLYFTATPPNPPYPVRPLPKK